jgi:tRNA (guanine-N7-)-methyltransferase
MIEADGGHPRIRSFVLRAGRVGPGQARALAEQGPRYLLPYQAQPLNFEHAFGRLAPSMVEIGFGMGEGLADIAAAHPHNNYLGIEVHTPGVGALLKQIGERGLDNVRVVQHDAVDVLNHMLIPASLAGVQIFFPDPWHKTRHHKRRLIQPPLVALLASRLQSGGTLHLATDWENYAEQMLAVLSDQPLIANTASDYAPRPDTRPLTKFEARGKRLGHGVWDLLFVRR